MLERNGKIGRRDLFKTSAGMVGGALLSREAAAEQAPQKNVNTNSSPSALKITDLRVCTIVKPGPSPCPIIRIDTNQGVYGLGEVRDGSSATYALFLKSRILNENPLNITFLFEKIKQFGFHGRQAGGVVAIEEALWDISGKVYNVPIYQMLGGKFRDRVRIYADTEESEDPLVFAQRLKARKEEMGLTWLKMDVGINLVEKIPGCVTAPAEQTRWELNQLPHPFVATEVTQKGIEKLSEYVQAARDAVGMEIPLSMDHLGHLGVNSIIRLGKAYEKFNLSWIEDVIPWQYTDMLAHITAKARRPSSRAKIFT
jgi:L-alanine-DL-glutamate epimerase-like enolase superfamily enzyme